jgi:two-component system sensor histidine kinase KdpD
LPSHGHSETAAQLQGLEILPLKSIEYKNRAFKEFGLDAALAQDKGPGSTYFPIGQ